MKQNMSLDQWRDYFRSANSDIFEIIDKSITVAAFDCPKEFKFHRDSIAEKLFTCRLTRCSGCDKVESECEDENYNRGCPANGEDIDDHGGGGGGGGGCDRSKESDISRDDDEIHANKNDCKIDSGFSYGEAEALTDEIEEESQVVDEVLRIKEILHNRRDESEKVLFDSLRKLQLMALTVDILMGTEIGKSVNVLRKHGSSEIRRLVRTLIDGWKVLVDEWVEATKAVTVAQSDTPDSVNPSVLDEEEGLPSPPLDDLVFLSAPPPSSMELSQFFDGMDEDGNPRNSREFVKNRESGRKPSVENQNLVKREVNVLNRNIQQSRNQGGTVVKPNKPLNTEYGLGRPPKVAVEQKVNKESKLQPRPDRGLIQRKLPSGQNDKPKCSDEVAVERKLEATKRKLQESYQQAEKAKKQRTVQVMELRDLPKQGLVNKNPNGRPFQNRQWANGRR